MSTPTTSVRSRIIKQVAAKLAALPGVGLVVDSSPNDQPQIAKTIAGDADAAIAPAHAIEWEAGGDETGDAEGSTSAGGYGLLVKKFEVMVMVHLSQAVLTGGETLQTVASDLVAAIEQLYYTSQQAQQWPEGSTPLALKTETTNAGGGVGFDPGRGTRCTVMSFAITYRHGMTDPDSPLPAGIGG